MKAHVTGKGLVDIAGLTPAGIPALRLLQYHSPDMTVGGHRLGDIDLAPSFRNDPINTDRAQLATLGASNHQLATAAAPTGGERDR